MENQESNSNAKLTSFSQEEATPNVDNNSKKNESIANKEIVTRPLLWGLVVFLVFFGLVIGVVSVYRMYSIDDMSQNINTPSTTVAPNSEVNTPTSRILNNTPVSTDTIKEANIVDSEIKAIDSDLEEDIYSDESLGL